MFSLFETLDFFDDHEPHSAPLNMAIDEVLLARLSQPLLRVYRWAAPSVSFGYFEKCEPVRVAYPQHELVRRWTGGGVVPHDEDFTYSLLVPKNCALAGKETAETYRMIHEVVAAVLREFGFDVSVAIARREKISAACFENPVYHDVLLNDRKIAGAAQRRTKLGLLHQGSVQQLALPPEFRSRLASRLSSDFRPWNFDAESQLAAKTLAAEKYGTPRWLEKF